MEHFDCGLEAAMGTWSNNLRNLQHTAYEMKNPARHIPYGEIKDQDNVLIYPLLMGTNDAGETVCWSISQEGSLLCFKDVRNAVEWCEFSKWLYVETLTLFGMDTMELALYCQREGLASYTIEDRGSVVSCL